MNKSIVQSTEEFVLGCQCIVTVFVASSVSSLYPWFAEDGLMVGLFHLSRSIVLNVIESVIVDDVDE